MFRLGAVIGGAAKRASEILEEERKEAMDTVNEQLKIWTELGLPKVRARKEARRTKNKVFDSLQSEGFSLPQIAVIMGQGRGEATLDHIQSQRNTYDDYVVKPAEIVAISPSYEDTGLTKDIILENEMGKVNKGSTITDAVASLSGQGDGTLTSLLGGNLSGISKRRMDAFATAAGVDMNELRALASDDITYDQPLVEGDVRLIDPATAATKKRQMQDSQSGLYTTSNFGNVIRNIAADLSGLDRTIDDFGNIFFKPDAANKDIKVQDIVDQVLDEYQTETGKLKFGFADTTEVKRRIRERLAEAGLLVAAAQGGGQGQGGGQQGGSGTGQGQGQGGGQGQSTGTNPFLGYSSINNLVSDAIAAGKGASQADQAVILGQVQAAMQAAGASQKDIDDALNTIRNGF